MSFDGHNCIKFKKQLKRYNFLFKKKKKNIFPILKDDIFAEFIKSVEEEYQVVNRGEKYHGCAVVMNIYRGKRERGSNIIFTITLRLLEGMLGEGKRTGEENKDLKRCGGKVYKIVGNNIHPYIR